MSKKERVSDALAKVSPTAVRHPLSARQARTVSRLIQAADDEVQASGYSQLTVRSVATRAGVVPATAYNYFASKEQLMAELYLQRFMAQNIDPVDPHRSTERNVHAVLGSMAFVVADEVELAAACTLALLCDDPQVKQARIKVGFEMRRRLRAALGDDISHNIIVTLEYAVMGMLLQVGTGHLNYSDVSQAITSICHSVLGEKHD